MKELHGKKPTKIEFAFNEEKATAAAAYLLGLTTGRRMEYIRLLKLLYLAERESLKRLRAPIIGDNYVSMEHGPVLSKVFNLVRKKNRFKGQYWERCIRTEDVHAVLFESPSRNPLSPAEERILQGVFTENVNIDTWALVKKMHDLPEWKKPKPGESQSTPIEVEHLLKILGRKEQIPEFAEYVAERKFIARILKEQ